MVNGVSMFGLNRTILWSRLQGYVGCVCLVSCAILPLSMTILLSGCSRSDESDPVATGKSILRILRASNTDELKGDVDLYSPTSADFERLNKKVLANPNNSAALRNRGNAYFHSDLPERYKLALDDYNKALSLDHGNASWYSERSSVFDNLHRSDEALRDVNKAIQLDGSESRFYFARASINSDLGRKKEALEDYARAARNEKPVGLYTLDLSRELAKQGKESEALELLNKVVSQNHDIWAADAREERITILISQGKFGQAQKELDQWKAETPENSNAFEISARLHQLLGAKDKARADYRQLVKIRTSEIDEQNSKNAIDYEFRADYLEKVGEAKKAAADRRKALALYEVEVRESPSKELDSFSNRAELYDKLGEHKKAALMRAREIELSGIAISKAPNDFDGYFSRASIFEVNKKYEQALRDYEKIKTLKPDDNQFIAYHADCLNRLKRYQEALDECKGGLKKGTINSEYLFGPMAEACLRLGQYDEAVKYATSKISFDRTVGDAYFWRSRAYEKLGKKDLAQRDLLLSKWYESDAVE